MKMLGAKKLTAIIWVVLATLIFSALGLTIATIIDYENKKTKQVPTQVHAWSGSGTESNPYLITSTSDITTLSNNIVNEETMLKASEIACEELVFGSNMRASKEYRKAICKLLVKNALMEVSSC